MHNTTFVPLQTIFPEDDTNGKLNCKIEKWFLIAEMYAVFDGLHDHLTAAWSSTQNMNGGTDPKQHFAPHPNTQKSPNSKVIITIYIFN